MSQDQKLKIIDLSLGDKVSVYLTNRKTIALVKTKNKISATIIGIIKNRNDKVSSICLGWKKDEEQPGIYKNKYYYHASPQVQLKDDLLHEFGLESFNLNKEHTCYELFVANANVQMFILDVADYKCFVWLNSYINQYGYPPVELLSGPNIPEYYSQPANSHYPYIKASEVKSGDTIVYKVASSIKSSPDISYITIDDIEEFENQKGDPMISFRGKVFLPTETRVYSQGYPVDPNSIVLLLNRKSG